MSTAELENTQGLEVVQSASGEGLREATGEMECICALCTCGLHRCPSFPAQNIPFSGESTYRQDFQEWECPRHGPIAVHEEYVRNPLKFEGTSTYAADFTPKKGERYEMPPVTPPEMEKIPFDGTTTYRTDFPVHEIQREPVPAPADYKYETLPFEGETETQAAFKGLQLPQENRVVQEQPDYHPSLPFEGESEYTREFTEKEVHVCPASRLPHPPAPSVNPNAWVEDNRVAGQHVLYDKQTRNWAQ